MKVNPAWLFLEPYVHVLCKDGVILLYNTVSKTVLEFRDSPLLTQLAEELVDPANGYVVSLSVSQMQDTTVQDFIHQLRKYYMGDILDVSLSDGRPVNIYPEPFVRFGLKLPPERHSAMAPDLDVSNYLQEITLFLNTGKEESIKPYHTAYLQCSYPAVVSGKTEEMDLHLFRTIIDDVNNSAPALIHISGMNLIAYPHLEDVLGILGTSPFQKKYHLPVEHWEERIIPYILIQKQTTLSLYIKFPTNSDIIAGYLQTLPDPKLLKKLEFNFLVSNQDELQMALEIIEILNLDNYFFKPFYDGGNIDFFSENVFISKEEILASQPDQQQVLTRISINEADFGKFSVLPGGEVYANLNDPGIGDATTGSLVQLVRAELEKGISWNRIRANVSPCKDCIYQFLCPPISSYEIFLKRFNFCDVYPNGDEL